MGVDYERRRLGEQRRRRDAGRRTRGNFAERLGLPEPWRLPKWRRVRRRVEGLLRGRPGARPSAQPLDARRLDDHEPTPPSYAPTQRIGYTPTYDYPYDDPHYDPYEHNDYDPHYDPHEDYGDEDRPQRDEAERATVILRARKKGTVLDAEGLKLLKKLMNKVKRTASFGDYCARAARLLRTIRVLAAAAAPRLVSTEYPRRGHGVAAARLYGVSASRPRRRRGSSQRTVHVAGRRDASGN